MPMIEFAFKHKLIKLQSDNYLDCSFFDNISFIYYLMVELSYLFGQFCIFADIYYNIMKIIFINTLRILMILVIMISCGVAYVVYEDTLAAWWIPVGVALIIVIATIPFYKGWIWLTTMDKRGTMRFYFNHAKNAQWEIPAYDISCVLFFGGNYWFADSASTHEEEVMVQKKYIETHKKTRRVGRHRYVSDGVRKEYYLQVAFENGNVETLHVSPSTYNKTKTGRPKILTLQKGLFGLPVITKGL